MRPRVTVVAADPVDAASMGHKLLKKIIEKIGVEATPLESIKEAVSIEGVKEMEMTTAEGTPMGKENEDVNMEEPEMKKMRMTDTEISVKE